MACLINLIRSWQWGFYDDIYLISPGEGTFHEKTLQTIWEVDRILSAACSCHCNLYSDFTSSSRGKLRHNCAGGSIIQFYANHDRQQHVIAAGDSCLVSACHAGLSKQFHKQGATLPNGFYMLEAMKDFIFSDYREVEIFCRWDDYLVMEFRDIFQTDHFLEDRGVKGDDYKISLSFIFPNSFLK